MTPTSERPGQRALRAVHEVAQAAQGAHEERELLERICASVAETIGFDRVFVSRVDTEEGTVDAVAAHGIALADLAALPRTLAERPLLERALADRELVFFEDVGREDVVPPEVVAGYGLRSVLVVPLIAGGRDLGLLVADRGGAQFSLDEDERQALETIAVLAATFLEHYLTHSELIRLDQLKTNFIALASHELRNPAAVIFGLSTTLFLRGRELTDDQLEELRRMLYEQSGRMRHLVDQLLDLSRLEAHSIRIEPERTHVRQRIEELILLAAPDHFGEIELDVPPELEATLDPNALDRVVSNLVVNAFRYGEPPVRVAAERRDRHFRLRVEDRGSGVPPEFVPQLFERFARGEGSGARAPGAGLGLSIAQSYAHAHGGELLYHQAKPHGACFELVLPAAPPGSRTTQTGGTRTDARRPEAAKAQSS